MTQYRAPEGVSPEAQLETLEARFQEEAVVFAAAKRLVDRRDAAERCNDLLDAANSILRSGGDIVEGLE